MDLRGGETMIFCTCGKSKNDPYCDNSHIGTGKKPISYMPLKSETYHFCRCKFSKMMPMCDHSHHKSIEELLGW
jgi:CDGSH-type Zn-finger protein